MKDIIYKGKSLIRATERRDRAERYGSSFYVLETKGKTSYYTRRRDLIRDYLVDKLTRIKEAVWRPRK